MPMTAVSQCAQCAAVININWAACLVCRAILPPVPDATAPPQLTPNNQRRTGEPQAPILSGWLVTYRDKTGKLCGGAEDRDHGTVQACRWEGGQWTLYLKDSQRLSLWQVVGVAKTEATGQVIAAWTVREHGSDGNGPFQSGEQ